MSVVYKNGKVIYDPPLERTLTEKANRLVYSLRDMLKELASRQTIYTSNVFLYPGLFCV